MLGIIYLLLAGMLGCEASKMLTGEGRSVSGINRIWLMLPASFGVGTLLLTWTVYIISWFFSVVGKAEHFHHTGVVHPTPGAFTGSGRIWRKKGQ